MNQLLKDVLFLVCLFSVANSALYYTYFWQLKEYRLDRMRDFLSTATGKKRMFWWPGIGKFLSLISPILLFLVTAIDVTDQKSISVPIWMAANFLLALVWFLEIGDFIYRLKRKRIYRPDLTVKAAAILAITIGIPAFVSGILVFRNIDDWSSLTAILVFLSGISFLLNHLLVLILMPITAISKNLVLKKAHRKIAQMQGLKVIGITGSYGKSSTKEFLAQILETKFKILKTPGNTNTEIGVAKVILGALKPEHEVFIVEAGAYKLGEIKKIARMVTPRIGIITAVKDSHLALFGSLENIKKAKFELIESLPEFGTAIFNADNQGSADLAAWAKPLKLAKLISYGMTGELKAEMIEENIEGVNFTVNGIKFSTTLPGKHNISNILAAMAAAMELGIKLEEMVGAIGQLKLRDHTMSIVKASDDLRLIDDTYNANPDGVSAALIYLSLHKDWQKIIIFPGMLELGKESFLEHQKIASQIAELCDYAFITSRDFEEPIRKSFTEKNFSSFQFITEDQQKLLTEVKAKISGKKSVVLFISRGSEQVLKKLQNAS